MSNLISFMLWFASQATFDTKTIKISAQAYVTVAPNATGKTGILVNLHNWGGEYWDGALDPVYVANKYGLHVLSVDYRQTGSYDERQPYDLGVMQAVDALNALSAGMGELRARGIPFDPQKVHIFGGSGGGAVALNAVKFAPNTFRTAVVMSAPLRMDADIAHCHEGGSPLCANWPLNTPNWQYELRDHTSYNLWYQWAKMKPVTSVILLHGTKDTIAPYSHFVDLDVTRNIIAKKTRKSQIWLLSVDEPGYLGTTDNRHSLGDRTQIFRAIAEISNFLDGTPKRHKTDAQRRSRVTYKTSEGQKIQIKHSGSDVALTVTQPRGRR